LFPHVCGRLCEFVECAQIDPCYGRLRTEPAANVAYFHKMRIVPRTHDFISEGLYKRTGLAINVS